MLEVTQPSLAAQDCISHHNKTDDFNVRGIDMEGLNWLTHELGTQIQRPGEERENLWSLFPL